MDVMVELKQIGVIYHTLEGEIEAVKDVSFSVEKGEFISIIGPSGCGKSTILSLISGLIKPSRGTVNVNGKIGYMLQKDYLFEWRTIYKNVIIGLEVQHMINSETEKRILKLMENYGLIDFKDFYPRQLSGGMRQRAALIRTLAIDPDILLLDEPFSSLDYQTKLLISDEIWSIIKKEGKTAILVTHDIAEAISMSDKIIVLSKRPAVVKNIYKIELTCEERTPIKCRRAPEFREYFNSIWKELEVHV